MKIVMFKQSLDRCGWHRRARWFKTCFIEGDDDMITVSIIVILTVIIRQQFRSP